MKIQMKAKSFKKMECPNDDYFGEGRAKYVCYIQCTSIPEELLNWMGTNPREQKMTTNVAKSISEGLSEKRNFHELNRGILMSVDDITYDNKSGVVEIELNDPDKHGNIAESISIDVNETFTIKVTNDSSRSGYDFTATTSKSGVVEIELNDPDKHGNIDGGHTLRAIIEAKKKQNLPNDRYVFFEAFTGLDSTVELAEARNTSVQVDLKSIEELKNSFECIKNVLNPLSFSNRIQYKMNEYCGQDIETIDVREILSIIIMFSQTIYPYMDKDSCSLSSVQPIQCYSGKEASLKKFINLGKDSRETMIKNMSPIISDIFKLWETIELDFTNKSSDAGKRYGTRKYSKYHDNEIVSQTTFEQQNQRYYIPKGIMYPLVGAFRALVQVDKKTNENNPIEGLGINVNIIE